MVAPTVAVSLLLSLYVERIEEAVGEHRFNDVLALVLEMHLSSCQFLEEGIITPCIYKVTNDFCLHMLSLIIDYQQSQ